MALFSTRAKSDIHQAPRSQFTVLSNEEFKRRAKNRLIGSFVLVVLAVLGFTWLLDSQPRPAINDVPVVIPSQDNSANWSAGAASDASASASVVVPILPASSTANSAVPTSSVGSTSTITSSSPSLNSLANLPVATASNAVSNTSKPTAVASVSKPTTPVKSATESKFAQAASVALSTQEKQKQQEQDSARKKEDLFVNAAKLPNTNKPSPDATATNLGQFVIQVGAYSDVNKAKEIKSKLEAAGLTAFTQNVKVNGVDLVRVRVGPFATKNSADQNTGKVKSLGLSAIVTSK